MLKEEQLDLDLPEEVVVNILCRLPVKSLIRFTCVSKRWRSLIISDHQFGNSHFQLASHLRRNVLLATNPTLVEEGTPGTPSMEPLPTRFQSLADRFPIRELTCPSELKSNIVVLGSCNGLVVSGKFQYSIVPQGRLYCDFLISLVIWNPSTGFFRKIPSPSFLIGMEKLAYEKQIRFVNRVYYGFGQVSTSDDYKLVVMPKIGDLMEVHVFSVKANSWKVVKTPYLWPYPLWSKERGTHSNGAIHWVSQHEPVIFEPRVNVFYAFDLASEEFREIPLPVLVHNEYSLRLRMTLVRTPVLLGGCLCVMFRDYDEYHDIWVMKEYGVHESWVKLFRFRAHDSTYHWNPIFIAEDGTVVISVPRAMEVVRIKCRKDEELVCTDRYSLEKEPGWKYLLDAILYDETLVSVPE
ncbi:hypothetical protein ACLB2K_045689 [Fragaria x ananassa]